MINDKGCSTFAGCPGSPVLIQLAGQTQHPQNGVGPTLIHVDLDFIQSKSPLILNHTKL
jgi:hypothetical protein